MNAAIVRVRSSVVCRQGDRLLTLRAVEPASKAHLLILPGGAIEPAARREYGAAKLKVLSGQTALFNNLPFELDVWMSHGDHVTRLPHGFTTTATTWTGFGIALAICLPVLWST